MQFMQHCETKVRRQTSRYEVKHASPKDLDLTDAGRLPASFCCRMGRSNLMFDLKGIYNQLWPLSLADWKGQFDFNESLVPGTVMPGTNRGKISRFPSYNWLCVFSGLRNQINQSS